MSSRIPLPYAPRVLELFQNPQNLGRMEDATIAASAGSPACGDMIAFYLKINEDTAIITKSSFESYGCASNIAAASQLTIMIENKSLEDSWNITWSDVSEALGGLPSIKTHCGSLAVGALRRAIRAYYNEISKSVPKWLPPDLTKDEKHALEEEALADKLAKKYKLKVPSDE
ncbi:MAG: iron-sulfur cluster assembly scaffold protein [Candidatus Heimdallarchaeota archaeon]